MDDVGIFHGHLVHFVAIWYILWSFGILFPILVSCIKTNLATLAAWWTVPINGVNEPMD
jgi:hypothetical protein